MKRTILGLAVIPFLLVSNAEGADKKCELQKYAELPVTMLGTRPLVSGTINGHPVRFLADSGAFFSLLTRHTTEKLGLKVGPLPPQIKIRGTGGAAQIALTKVKDFTLAGFNGGRTINNVDFLVGGSDFADDTAGIIGQNLLGDADAEYDLANGAIRIFRAENCSGPILAYWAQGKPVAELKIEATNPLRPHLIGDAKINGKKIEVMFDTGAWRSILTLDAAARAGIEPEDDGVFAAGVSRGLGKKTTENSLARFDTLDLGGEVIKNARLRIGDIRLTEADMLLGADFFLSHRIYVSTKQKRIYFTYNGGPVFDLRASPFEAKAPSNPTLTAASDAAATPTSTSTLDASALRRRGAASAGRRDFDAAIADFDQAIKLEPHEPENFYQRGLARWEKGQPMMASADFDETLKLKPEHVACLMSRGLLRLRANNETGAKADFNEALKLSPKDPSIGFRIAESYQSAGHFQATIEQLDAWIAAYPKDDRISVALNGRCMSRAILGKELELARADCDEAVKKGPKNSVVFDSRALVFLQLGEFDKAISDYKAALRLQPRKASSLYGLGLAEQKKGLKESAASNMQAATEIQPGVASLFRRAGLVTE